MSGAAAIVATHVFAVHTCRLLCAGRVCVCDLDGGVPLGHLDVLRVPVEHGQTFELLVGVRGPYPHALVAGARGEHVAIAGPRHAFHLVLVSLERRHALEFAALILPDRRDAVESGGGEKLAAR